MCRLAVLAVLFPAVAAAAPSPLLLATCAGQTAEYTATIRDTLLLDSAFFDASRPEALQIEEGIRQQLKYFWGWFRTHKGTHRRQRIVVGAEEPSIRILAQRRVAYGRDLLLDWQETSPELQIEDAYTRRAVQVGRARAADPAWAVTYEARLPLAMCGEPRPATSTLRFAMPRDPWLMHWHVAAANRRLVRYREDAVVTNPCVDDDYADLPHPYYYWYDWLPERHGIDGSGRAFDCRRWLRRGVDFWPRTARVERTAVPSHRLQALSARFAPLRRPLEMTVVLGVLEHAWPRFDYPELAAHLGAGVAELPERASAAMVGPHRREFGQGNFLQLLRGLPSVMQLTGYSASAVAGFLQVEVRGVLRRSGRPIHLSAHLGITDVLGPTAPHHWPILYRALTSADIIVYGGHSGVGENFRLSRILADQQVAAPTFAAAFRAAPFQLIAFLSCFSYMYFGRDLEAAARHTAGRAFVYTGSEYSEGDRGTLAILDLVDQALAPNPAPPVLHGLRPEDFFLVKEVLPER